MPEYSEKGFQSIEEIAAFIKKYSVKNVSISPSRVKNYPADLEVLHKEGVRVFSPGWNTPDDLKTAKKSGVDVATTDLPMCDGSSKMKKLRYRLLSHLLFGKKAAKYKEKYKRLSACIIR